MLPIMSVIFSLSDAGAPSHFAPSCLGKLDLLIGRTHLFQSYLNYISYVGSGCRALLKLRFASIGISTW